MKIRGGSKKTVSRSLEGKDFGNLIPREKSGWNMLKGGSRLGEGVNKRREIVVTHFVPIVIRNVP